MTEPRDTKHSGKLDEELVPTANDENASGDDRDDRDVKKLAPQGGKGTPSQAEGERRSGD